MIQEDRPPVSTYTCSRSLGNEEGVLFTIRCHPLWVPCYCVWKGRDCVYVLMEKQLIQEDRPPVSTYTCSRSLGNEEGAYLRHSHALCMSMCENTIGLVYQFSWRNRYSLKEPGE
jgi:hypothetical protein